MLLASMSKIAEPKSAPPLKVGMISLGCAKNLVDAEIMLGSLIKDGVEITNDPAQADVLIVNTCSFIDSAQEESVDTILESSQVREAEHRGQGLIVAGCLPQRFREDLPKLLPEVDAFMGIDQVAQAGTIVRQAFANRAQKLAAGASKRAASPRRVSRHLAELEKARPMAESGTSLRGTDQFGKTRQTIAPPTAPAVSGPLFEVHSRPTFIPDYATPRFRLTPRHFAYVKIAEGCNHPCSFCIIPQMRGTHRSRAQSDVVAESRALLADGVKELNLISQDSTYYGLDLRPNHSRAIAAPAKFNAAVQSLAPGATTLSSLIRELNTLPGDFWIRLLYTHPAHWTEELIQTIAECPKVARYIDIPLQHIHPNLLERMRRETTREYIVDLLARIRSGVPGIALRTTFIVGFPGETEEAFSSLLDFIRETRFERLGVFSYSQEDGTRAGRMAGQVPDEIKSERRNRAMAAQHEIAAAISGTQVGRTLRVLVEREAKREELRGARVDSWEHGLIRGEDQHRAQLRGKYLIARAEADAPDIDGRVYVRGSLPLGEFARVRIVGHTDYDLIAEPQTGPAR
jgi:ribosomal protein S12 methylthiotransferase